MKTVLSRLKTVLQNNATLKTYIKQISIVSPKLLPDISNSMVPYIGIAPISTSETWYAQKKQATHSVDLYIVNWLQIPEVSIMGDSVKKGLLEIVTDVESAVRGQRLSANSVYLLSKPIEITGVDYVVSGYGDNIFLLIASMVLQCVELFEITLP